MREYVSGISDPVERLEVFVSRASSILKDNEDFMRFFLEVMSMGARDPEIRLVMTDYYTMSISNFSRIIEDGIANGAFYADNPGEVACAVYFLSMGVFFAYFTINPDFDLGDQHAIHINNVLLGLKKIRVSA